MVYIAQDMKNVEYLFKDWEETLIVSCLQKVMGKIYVTDPKHPVSACAHIGCFLFFAGEPDRELVEKENKGFIILVPQNKSWAELIAATYPAAKQVRRFATRKDTEFDRGNLQKLVNELPDGYEMKPLDAGLYDPCLKYPDTEYFVNAFESKKQYLELGRGVVILKDGEIVSGASSYTRYREGIEIEVDTVPSERRKHLATAACAGLILQCLDEGLYPSWDAQNLWSLALAEKLGYQFSYEYVAYEALFC